MCDLLVTVRGKFKGNKENLLNNLNASFNFKESNIFTFWDKIIIFLLAL